MTAQQELIELTRSRAKEKQIPFSEALLFICHERPELASEYRAEILKSPTIFEATPKKEEFTPRSSTRELMRLAKAKSQEDGVSFREAVASIARHRPILASEYRREVVGGKE